MHSQINRVSCPVCLATGAKPLCRVDGYDISHCPECEGEFIFPMPTDGELKLLYDRKEWFEGGEKGGYAGYDEQTENVLPLFHEILDTLEQKVSGRSILDIGCGYGTHLAIASQRGWKAFGVEVSDHARAIAQSRHGKNIYVVDKIESLVPHEFDVILMLDVIEHFPDPYAPFYALFSKGAIQPKTVMVIATPNAASVEATKDPGKWVYRHPPSHLVYYSAKSLATFLERLHFTSIEVRGLHPFDNQIAAESPADLSQFAGLLCQASGSDFKDFMQERYVPGTWSKLAEYEHLPRYVFASNFASGRTVLDFGCGSGYGSARLSEVAHSVIGLDVDDAALHWARATHKNENLRFVRSETLGSELPAQSVDLITCFEMIEHIDGETQKNALESFARLLKPDGKLLISTPNPAVTAQYGENPFHLRELGEDEFEDLLRRSFADVRILRQHIRPSVTISSDPRDEAQVFENFGNKAAGSAAPAAFVAICSNSRLPEARGLQYFDTSFDFIAERTDLDRKLDQLRFANFTLTEQNAQIQRGHDEVRQRNQQLGDELSKEQLKNQELGDELSKEQLKNQELNTELNVVKGSKLFRLRDTMKNDPLSPMKIAKMAYLTGAMATPEPVRRLLSPAVRRIKNRIRPRVEPPTQIGAGTYLAKVVRPIAKSRPRVMHAIANFMTGGSSRLVVDLFEETGHLYEQEVIAGFVPNPASYAGLPVKACGSGKVYQQALEEIRRFRPDLVHIHYWGDCDRAWYQQVFVAAEHAGSLIVENVNTPVDPYLSSKVQRYVFVSDYVNQEFGARIPSEQRLTIHPGTNFSLFTRNGSERPPDDCIGMVYRLEPDKLNLESIDAFIHAIKKRPRTKALIIGGGTFLEKYKQRVAHSGLESSFEFTDYVNYESLPSLYERLSVFVAPIWKESFGQVSPMAMHMGIPVVGYNVGGLREIVNDPSLLAPGGDSNKLAAIITELLKNPERRYEIGRRNMERARSMFSLEAMTENYQQLYRQVLSTNR